jgi:hypothetical protein
VKRLLVLLPLWLMGALACGLVFSQLVVFISGSESKWRHSDGSRFNDITIGNGYIGLARGITPRTPALPTETASFGRGGELEKVSFWFGFWHHRYDAAYYSSIPNDTFDWSKIAQYRYALQLYFKALFLDV